MSLEALRVYSEGLVQTSMNSQYPAITVKYENAPFPQPDGAWASFSVNDGHGLLVNIGTRKVDRHLGIVQFDSLVPQNTGTSMANQVAEYIGNIFRDSQALLQDGSKVIFKAPSYISLGVQGGFYRICMRCGYWRDEPARVSVG